MVGQHIHHQIQRPNAGKLQDQKKKEQGRAAAIASSLARRRMVEQRSSSTCTARGEITVLLTKQAGRYAIFRESGKRRKNTPPCQLLRIYLSALDSWVFSHKQIQQYMAVTHDRWNYKLFALLVTINCTASVNKLVLLWREIDRRRWRPPS
jgi:hypothetical protein